MKVIALILVLLVTPQDLFAQITQKQLDEAVVKVVEENKKLTEEEKKVLQYNLEAILGRLDKLEEKIDSPGKVERILSNRYFQMIAVALTTFITQQQMTHDSQGQNSENK